MEKVTTIAKKDGVRGGLVLVPQREYEAFFEWKKKWSTQIFKPTVAERKALTRARKDLKEGKFITLHELRASLGY